MSRAPWRKQPDFSCAALSAIRSGTRGPAHAHERAQPMHAARSPPLPRRRRPARPTIESVRQEAQRGGSRRLDRLDPRAGAMLHAGGAFASEPMRSRCADPAAIRVLRGVREESDGMAMHWQPPAACATTTPSSSERFEQQPLAVASVPQQSHVKQPHDQLHASPPAWPAAISATNSPRRMAREWLRNARRMAGRQIRTAAGPVQLPRLVAGPAVGPVLHYNSITSSAAWGPAGTSTVQRWGRPR